MLGPSNYLFVRQLAGLLFLLDLLAYIPYGRVCLGAGYWGASHKRLLPLVVLLWVGGSLSLVLGIWPFAGALVMWLLFRHYYVANRWKNLFRGGGAPGFMSHWAGLYILLYEAARLLDPSGGLTASVRTMSNVDFGIVLLCSGSYKALSGYMRGEGMEYGLANPFWGYFFPLFKKIKPTHFALRAQDMWAPTAQILTGLCLLGGAFPSFGIPQLRAVGAALCFASFGYLLPTVRLGRLAVLMMAVALWFAPDFGWALPQPLARDFGSIATTPAIVIDILQAATIAYIVILPFVKGMQYLNLFGKRELPGPMQRALTWYANKVPIIMWRVFTPDVTNFFVRIYRVDRETKERTPLLHEDTTYSYKDLGRLRWSLRFLHVTESIALTTVFTTLKYFRSQRPLFEEKVRAYAHTLGEEGAILLFEYVAIMKGEERFEFVPVSEFALDLVTDELTETRLIPDYDYAAPAPFSHIKETIGYGSYAPKTVPSASPTTATKPAPPTESSTPPPN